MYWTMKNLFNYETVSRTKLDITITFFSSVLQFTFSGFCNMHINYFSFMSASHSHMFILLSAVAALAQLCSWALRLRRR